MHWKYWQSWPGWVGARSFVATEDGIVIAHAAVVPLQIARDGSELTLLQPLDWAAEPSHVGAGVSLLKQLHTRADGLVNIRGSEATQRILVALGYRSLGPVSRFVRPLALPMPLSAAAESCTLRTYRDSIAGASPHPLHCAESQANQIVPRRTLAHFAAWLACPVAQMEYAELFRARERVGTFFLCRTPGQVRWIDAWARVGHHSILAEYATRRAAETGTTASEIVCQTNDPEHERALLDAGYRRAGADPLSVLASKDLIADGAAFRHYLIDSDLAYLHHGDAERWSENLESSA
jgi:hypothetical protein